jgi:hypothetical protein
MEAVVILRRQSEDGQRATNISVRVGLVCVTQQTRNSELAALNPELGCLLDRRKCHEAAVSSTDQAVWIVGCLDKPSRRFHFSVEELIEGF